MFQEDPKERWGLDQIGRLREDGTWEYQNQWLNGSLPSKHEIAQEIARVGKTRGIGSIFKLKHLRSKVDLSVSDSKIIRSPGSEGGERLDVDDDCEMLK